VRAVRSDLVELGSVSASIGSQASREGHACVQSAALSVTQKDVTQQIELRDAAKTRFAIVDIAPDGSAILLTAERNRKVQMGVVSLASGALHWTSLAELIRTANCDAPIEAQGFLDVTHLVVAEAAAATGHRSVACPDNATFYSVEVESHRVKVLNSDGFTRQAKVVSGAIQTCKSDPDVVRGCYSSRARLAISPNGQGMQLWTFGSNRSLSVEYGMVPGGLSSRVTPETRMLATMVICPMAVAPRTGRQVVCVDSAVNIRPETGRKTNRH